MRLVMGGESLQGPLTGIGQYTYHLSREMLTRPEVEDLKFLCHGQLRSPSSMISAAGGVAGVRGRKQLNQFLGRARSFIAQSKPAVALYKCLVPRFERHALRSYGSADVFHSPNYMLPNFPGRKVVSILDLSTYRFPEQHPAARVQFVNHHIKRTLKHADHIITISNLVKDEIIGRFGYPEENITVTYLAADELFQPISKYDFRPTGEVLDLDYKKYFLFVSSIEPRKNLERLLDAYVAYRANSDTSSLPLVVAGTNGWKSQHIHKRLKLLQAQGAVYNLGYVDQKVLPILMAGARALLYPSVYEGFGLPVLEAMQSGTAVITSLNSAMSEVADQAALLVDPQSTLDIKNAISTVADDLNKVAELEKRGIDRAALFSWSRCAASTIATYERR